MSTPNPTSNVPYPAGWNDPPNGLFNRANSDQSAPLSIDYTSNMQKFIDKCQKAAGQSQLHTRMMEDSLRKLQPILSGSASSSSTPGNKAALQKLSEFLNASAEDNHQKASEILVDLMKTSYNSDNQWILGLKRMMDILNR